MGIGPTTGEPYLPSEMRPSPPSSFVPRAGGSHCSRRCAHRGTDTGMHMARVLRSRTCGHRAANEAPPNATLLPPRVHDASFGRHNLSLCLSPCETRCYNIFVMDMQMGPTSDQVMQVHRTRHYPYTCSINKCTQRWISRHRTLRPYTAANCHQRVLAVHSAMASQGVHTVVHDFDPANPLTTALS